MVFVDAARLEVFQTLEHHNAAINMVNYILIVYTFRYAGDQIKVL